MQNYRYMNPLPMPRGTHFGNNYYLFTSRKVGRRVKAFSNLEYDNLIDLEMNHEVEYYCEQPCKAEITEEGVKKESIFDVWVLYRDGREEFQEVKYDSEINDPDPESRTRRQILIQQQWCKFHNQKHVIRTDKDLYIGPYYMENLRFMASKVRRYCIPSEIQDSKEREILKLIEDKYQTVETICASRLLPEGMEPDFLSMMYYKGLIRFSNIEDAIINGKTGVYSYG